MYPGYGYYGGGGSWMLFLFPAILFAMYAQLKVSTSFNKYLRVQSRSGYTGKEVARTILDRNGLYDVRIEPVAGNLTDHYDPRTKVVRLSSNVYNGTSIAAVSVAAHEVGHAMQHGEGYFPLILRNNIAPYSRYWFSASVDTSYAWANNRAIFIRSGNCIVFGSGAISNHYITSRN